MYHWAAAQPVYKPQTKELCMAANHEILRMEARQEPFLIEMKERKHSRYCHVSRHKGLSKDICTGHGLGQQKERQQRS